MITANNSEMAYVSSHGPGTEKLKTFWQEDRYNIVVRRTERMRMTAGKIKADA